MGRFEDYIPQEVKQYDRLDIPKSMRQQYELETGVPIDSELEELTQDILQAYLERYRSFHREVTEEIENLEWVPDPENYECLEEEDVNNLETYKAKLTEIFNEVHKPFGMNKEGAYDNYEEIKNGSFTRPQRSDKVELLSTQLQKYTVRKHKRKNPTDLPVHPDQKRPGKIKYKSLKDLERYAIALGAAQNVINEEFGEVFETPEEENDYLKKLVYRKMPPGWYGPNESVAKQKKQNFQEIKSRIQELYRNVREN